MLIFQRLAKELFTGCGGNNAFKVCSLVKCQLLHVLTFLFGGVGGGNGGARAAGILTF